MSYNHGREERKWRLWKEAEKKKLRESGVDEGTIDKLTKFFNEEGLYHGKNRADRGEKRAGRVCS